MRTFLDSICLVRVLFTRPRKWGSAVGGMAAFWAADAMAAWAALAAFGLHMNAAAMFTGFATGMVFTRRNGPLAGAGVLTLVLAVSIWASGAPFATAITGIFAYRIMASLLPVPPCLATLPTLRRIGRAHSSDAARSGDAGRAPGGQFLQADALGLGQQGGEHIGASERPELARRRGDSVAGGTDPYREQLGRIHERGGVGAELGEEVRRPE